MTPPDPAPATPSAEDVIRSAVRESFRNVLVDLVKEYVEAINDLHKAGKLTDDDEETHARR